MRVAVSSDDFIQITPKPGKARRFLIFNVSRTGGPVLEDKLVLAEDVPCFHDLHFDDVTPHPIDGMTLITGEAGEGFQERLARRSIDVHITSESDPVTAIKALLAGELLELSPSPHRGEDGNC
jgi:predicted Fe-Mo cluster-binding NifX family protein